MEQIIEISPALWLIVNNNVHPELDDILFTLRDNTGGNVLVDKAEIPELIKALQALMEAE